MSRARRPKKELDAPCKAGYLAGATQLSFSRIEVLSPASIRLIRASAVKNAKLGNRQPDLRGVELSNSNPHCRAPRAAELERLARISWLSIYDRFLRLGR